MEAGKINIDFEVIPTYNPQKLLVGDASVWLNAENKPAYILITPPGSKKAISNSFQKERINIFTSVNLGMSCLNTCGEQDYVDLPDGIWTINVKSAYQGIEKIRYYLKTDRFRLELDKIYIKASLEYNIKDKQLREDFSDVELMIRTAEAFARDGDFSKASRDFSEAQKILKKYQDCKNCL